ECPEDSETRHAGCAYERLHVLIPWRPRNLHIMPVTEWIVRLSWPVHAKEEYNGRCKSLPFDLLSTGKSTDVRYGSEIHVSGEYSRPRDTTQCSRINKKHA
ncbi:unnamed protein product, partial [Ectocarpus sp. 8 AP-2014]